MMNMGLIFILVCGGLLVMLLLVGGAVFFFMRKSRETGSSVGDQTPAKPKVETRDDSWLHEGNFSSDVVRGEPSTPQPKPIKPGSNIVGTCSNCGGEIEAGWTVCQYCGNPL